MRVRYQWIVAFIVVAALAGGGFLLSRRNAGVPATTPNLPTAAPGTTVSTDTNSIGVSEAPKVVDIPTPPPGIAKKVTESGIDGLTAEERAAWEAYLAETAKVVSENSEALRVRLDAAVEAIKSGDKVALGGMFAPDESTSADFVAQRVRAYPRIKNNKVQSSVGVFSVSQATVYFGYAVVQWEDGGIVSEHTIAVPMRFVNGSWYLTSIGPGTRGIASVQTVKL
ncbi:MAG: hypothetical protein CVT59_06670 [Actinobacteria bacterium HGW-Actinobacteria-1]|jgi:hypothetical protein|nr:MAG: hypothetical protein CVT59_06670 [Actinobacteria bacterium HGW-Actinobacteria-1]